MPGEFIPHVRIVKTALDYADEGKDFGLPYVSVSEPAPFDTTLLNYNWQIWNTKAFLCMVELITELKALYVKVN